MQDDKLPPFETGAVVHMAFTLLILLHFIAQQFVCCVESCNTCSDTVEPLALVCRDCCEHEHGYDSQPPVEGGSSHHLCVATHLFYLPAPHLELDRCCDAWSPLYLPMSQMVDEQSSIEATSYSVPPPKTACNRAELGVWTI